MPIHRERFDAISAEEETTTAERIVVFLYENRDKAFTRGEIADAIDRNPNTVATNLTRLKKRRLVQHKGQYWAITDDRERLADAVQFSNALAGLNDQLGPLIKTEEDAEAWASAQPNRPHPSEECKTEQQSESSPETDEKRSG